MGMILSLRDKLMTVERNSHMLNTILTFSCMSLKLSKLGTLLGFPQKMKIILVMIKFYFTSLCLGNYLNSCICFSKHYWLYDHFYSLPFRWEKKSKPKQFTEQVSQRGRHQAWHLGLSAWWWCIWLSHERHKTSLICLWELHHCIPH